MRSKDALEPPEALVLTMVLVAAADGGITDREIGVMAGQAITVTTAASLMERALLLPPDLAESLQP